MFLEKHKQELIQLLCNSTPSHSLTNLGTNKLNQLRAINDNFDTAQNIKTKLQAKQLINRLLHS